MTAELDSDSGRAQAITTKETGCQPFSPGSIQLEHRLLVNEGWILMCIWFSFNPEDKIPRYGSARCRLSWIHHVYMMQKLFIQMEYLEHVHFLMTGNGLLKVI